MYKELLKQHEDILKKLTDKANKETDFGERGQFMNLQKMINNEIEAIDDLKRIYKESELNKLCAYKLGVGKILIGQRGSGISSTLIDECLKYNRPLIVESNRRAENLVKQYPNLMVAYFIKDFTKNCLELMNANKETVNWNNKQVNVELNTTNNINKDIIGRINGIKSKVGIIGTVGISYEIEEEHENWIPRNSETLIKEVKDVKPIGVLSKYVYVYCDYIEDTKFKMIYFNNFECPNMITITNIRNFKSVDDICDALFVAKSLGYKPIINKINGGSLLCNVLGNDSKYFIYKTANGEDYSSAYIRFAKKDIVITFQSKQAQEAIDLFNEECLSVVNGRFNYIPKVEDDNSNLLKELILAIHLIKEDNK